MDQSLLSYVRAHLLRANPSANHQQVETYLASNEFKKFVTYFDKNLLLDLGRFLASEPPASRPESTPAASTPQPSMTGPDNVRPMPLVELTLQRQQDPMPAGATPTATAAPVTPVPMPDTVATVPSQSALAPTQAAASTTELTSDDHGLPSMAPNPRLADALARVPALTPVPARLVSLPPVPLAPPASQCALPQPDLGDIAFRLPNARAGDAYTHRIAAVDSTEAVVFDDIIVPEGLALSADVSTGTVSGTPSAAGDFKLTVYYHFARQSASRRRFAQVQVVVMPDPRTMWKNLPSDRNDPYWKADEHSDSVRGADLAIVAASKRGRSHAHVGSFRDDDFRIAHVAESGWFVAVVADGAGSARYSRRGAELICEEAQKRILASLTESAVLHVDASAHAYAQARADAAPPERVAALREELHTHLSRIVGNAAYYAARAIFDEMAARADLGGVFKDYSSTALIAVCKRYDFGILCAAYWVGDGAVGIYSKRDGITLLGEVDSGEYSGQTRFLDNAAVEHDMLRKRTHFAIVDDMTALVVMTDGVSDAKFETEARLKRADDWHLFWEDLESTVGFTDQDATREQKLLDWLDFWSQGNHDDRTVAIIH